MVVGAMTPTITLAESWSPETRAASARSTVETVLFAVTTGLSCFSVDAYYLAKVPVDSAKKTAHDGSWNANLWSSVKSADSGQ